jgi:hypothetical protein
MPNIIISYRRSDSDAIAGRIRDRLANHFGENSVFMDIDSIPFGLDFREHIKDALAKNDILIAIIGPKWTGAGKAGHLRINDETDPVRIEVETALKRGIPVVPVLVGGATMPEAGELPESLRDLSYRNAAEVDAGRDFNQHMDRLIRSLDRILEVKSAAAAAAASVPTEREKSPPAPEPARSRHGSAPSDEGSRTSTAATGAPATAPEKVQFAAAARRTSGLHNWLVTLLAVALCASLVTLAWLYLKLPSANERQVSQQAPASSPDPAAPMPTLPAPRLVPQEPQNAAPAPPPQPQANPEPQAARPAAIAPVTPPSANCKPNVAAEFQDDFKSPDPGWATNANVFFADGQMVIKAGANAFQGAVYLPIILKNPVVCAHVKAPAKIENMSDTAAGVVFWVTDASNYYSANAYPDGDFLVFRHIDSKRTTVVTKRRSESIRKGTGAINELSVAVMGNAAAFYINGAKAQEFKGQPPPRGGGFGLLAESEKNQQNEWRFLDIAVYENQK